MTTLDGVSYLSQTQEPEVVNAGDNTKLGKDAFLKLLVTQMQNQDPLNPQSNEEFVAQLSQFTQVEQLMDLSSQFDGMYMAMNSVNNTSMTQLLGKEVVALGDGIHYSGEGELTLHYDAAAATSGSNLKIYDESGSIVYSGAAGALMEGEGSIVIDPKGVNGQTLPEGNYRFSISGFDSAGESVEVTELMVGLVDGMSYETGVPLPSIHDIDFSLGQILRVGIPE
jgi:flagellar basal-body rod modification protein FlgD